MAIRAILNLQRCICMPKHKNMPPPPVYTKPYDKPKPMPPPSYTEIAIKQMNIHKHIILFLYDM